MLLSSCHSLIYNLFPFQYHAYARVEIQQKNKSNGQNANMEIKAAHAISYTILWYDSTNSEMKIFKYLP